MTTFRVFSGWYGRGMNPVSVFLCVAMIVHLQRSEMVAFGAEIPKKNITCHAGNYFVGDNASVTCNFPIDVGADESDVIVGRLPVNASKDAIWIDALTCGWETGTRGYNCHAAEGFSFNGTISDHLTLEIPAISAEKAGVYICFNVLSDFDSTECKLTLKEIIPSLPELTTAPNVTISHSREKAGTDNNVALISVLVVVTVGLLAAVVVIVVVFVKRRNARNTRIRENRETEPLVTRFTQQPLIPPQKPDEKVLEILRGFELSTQMCERLMQELEGEIKDCEHLTRCQDGKIDGFDEKGACDKMYSFSVQFPPNGTDTDGDGVAIIEVNNRKLRIHHVSFQGERPDTHFKDYSMSADVKLEMGNDLLNFIADSARKCYKSKFHRKKLHLGFVLPFPCEYQDDLTEARLGPWTNGYHYDDIVGGNLKELLQDAFREKHLKSHLEVTVILSDAAGTLLSLVRQDPKCQLAFSVNDGFHVCYSDNVRSNKDAMTLTDVVFGAMGENSCLKDIMTDYDRDINPSFAQHQRQNIPEKMVSMTHMGEIVRSVLVRLTKQGLLFKSVPSRSFLHREKCFTTEYISLIESDDSEQYSQTSHVLKKLHIELFTKEDCRVVSYTVRAVVQRAAHLTATGLAVLIKRLKTSEVTVAVDGALYRYHPLFLGHVCARTRELLKSETEVEFKPSWHGSVMGAALVANVPRSSRTA